MLGAMWVRLRFASPEALGFGGISCMVAAVVMNRTEPRAPFLTGLLFGMAVGLGVFAFGVWLRRRA